MKQQTRCKSCKEHDNYHDATCQDRTQQEPAPNARFWTFENGDYVKITLSPGQELSWGKRWSHEEGWSSEFTTWSYEQGHVIQESGTDGVDCDGRLSTWHVTYCKVEDLKTREAWRGWDDRLQGPGLPVPAWSDSKSSQRDYSAEAMGY